MSGAQEVWLQAVEGHGIGNNRAPMIHNSLEALALMFVVHNLANAAFNPSGLATSSDVQCCRHSVSSRCSSPMLVQSRYTLLESPQQYEELISNLVDDSPTVVKFVSPLCRTCKASTAKLSFVANQWPRTDFYEVSLTKGSPFIDWVKDRGITQLPFIEVYLGPERIESFLAPPSRVRFLTRTLEIARQRIRYQRRRRAVQRIRKLLRKKLTLKAFMAQLRRVPAGEDEDERRARVLQMWDLRSQLVALTREQSKHKRRLRWDRIIRLRVARR